MSPAPKEAPVELAVECLEPGWDEAWPGWTAGVETAARAALAALPPVPHPAVLSLVLTNDAHIRELNRNFRGKDKPTNVLSFPLDDAAEAETQGRPQELGDVILALETIAQESVNQNKSLKHHSAHLIVHGILHIFGYDHDAADAAEAMESLEREILARLGIPDPYGDPASARA
jgi:probable rRNA maturation factor